MWLLESDVFEDGRKWLRPGRVYLFGRTAEDTNIAIAHKTISRKHITIHVDEVVDGDGANTHARSRVTIEEMNSKKGTLLNGTQIRGQTTSSFTKREIEAGSWKRLRDQLQQLDIKYLGSYDQLTTHVVSKKRNTSKTLQALVSGKPIVSVVFVTAVVAAAAASDDADEGTASAFRLAPDERRQDVFAGYSFVFYKQKHHENLAPVIQLGQGKAFFKEVVEGGTGSLDDDGEGKRVVVVDILLERADDVEWWTNFYTSFARHLDHRPPDRRKDQPQSEDRRQVDQPEKENEEPTPPQRRARAGRPKSLQGFRFRLDSDEDKSMEDIPAAAATKATQPATEIPASQDSQSLFVSQRQEPVDEEFSEQESRPTTTTRSTRSQPKPTCKRALSPLPEHDVSELLDAIAPTATAAKRRRIEAGQPALPEPTPEPEEPPAVVEDDKREEADALAAAERQALLDAAGDDEVDYAAIRRLHIIEEFDVRMPNRDVDDLDEREEAIADGRWDPRWNGRRNFKKFRKQKRGGSDNASGDGAAVDQQPRRPLITLEEVKPKEYGMGDGYWLEDTAAGSVSRRNTQTQGGQGGGQSQSQAQTAASQNRNANATDTTPTEPATAAAEPSRSRAAKAAEKAAAARRAQQTATTQSEVSSGSGVGSKHGAPASGGGGGQPAAKRAKTTTGSGRRFEVKDSDEDSDESDGLKFRFGRRK
ncbi:hypothetical protein B0T09DRAFT_361674 [Sordaria sp. MPI-SDFR-AT-0083]|nr:hypothetical protein B0T09DRAFT_361674 [Sordaria sp. MPI-SDFR-AT-0083]